MNHFLIGLCDVWRKVNFMTTSNDQISGWSEKLKSTSQSQTCTKKRSWSLLVVCCPSDPLQLSEFWGHHYTSEKYTQQVHEMHQKLQCLQSALVNRMSPVLLHDNAWLHVAQLTLQKVNKLGYEGLPHLPHSLTSRQLTTMSSSISTTFCRKKASSTSRRQKMLSKSLSNPKASIFKLQKKTNISCWQKCVDCNGSCFD